MCVHRPEGWTLNYSTLINCYSNDLTLERSTDTFSNEHKVPFRTCIRQISAQLCIAYILYYTVFYFLGDSPRPRSEEVHSLLPSPEFKKSLSFLGVARTSGEAVWLWSKSMIYILEDEWLLQLSLGEDGVVLPSPLPRHFHEHIMGHLDFSLSLSQDRIHEVLLLQVRAVPQTSFCCHDSQFNQRQSLLFGFAQASHFSGRRKTE